MKPEFQKPLILLIVVAVLAAGFFLIIGGSHIEDTNGPDDHTLVTITDADILGRQLSSTFTMHAERQFGNHTVHEVGKFSGIFDLEETDVLYSTGMQVTVSRLTLKNGNLRLLLIMDGVILHEFQPSESEQSFLIEAPKGVICLRIAGESAEFELEYTFG